MLKINEIYLVHNGYFPTFNKAYFEALVPMVHTHTTHRMDDGKRFYFECPVAGIHESSDQWSLQSTVFKDEDDFLKYSVYESNRIGNKMDDFFLGLIEKSREEQPQKWI